MVMLLNVFELKGVVKEETKQKSLLYPYVEQTIPYVYQGFDLVKEAVQNTDSDTDVDVDVDVDVDDASLPIGHP